MVLSELGIPFINQVYELMMTQRFSLKGGQKPEIVGHYIKRLMENTTIYSGFWDTDIGINEIIDKDIKEDNKNTRDIKLMEELWGKYPDDEYVEALLFKAMACANLNREKEMEKCLDICRVRQGLVFMVLIILKMQLKPDNTQTQVKRNQMQW